MNVQIKNLICQNIHLYVHFYILLRDPAIQKVVHTACANQTNSVLNIKNALTNWVILQQICTKNKLK